MDRCTGCATSTFGGGGGTKLFCSQALKTPNAATAKTVRHAIAPPCLAARCGLLHDGERIGFMSVPQSFVLERLATQRNSLRRHAIKIATIHLQGNPKPKMMPYAKFFSPFRS
jgi:hypothetical protein